MMATPHVRHTPAEIRWSSTRTECGVRTLNGHPCGRAAGHGLGGCVCRCQAERALESMGAYVGAVAS